MIAESVFRISIAATAIAARGQARGARVPSDWAALEDRPEIPSFCILQISVVRFRPSLAAAPFGPPITHAVASSVCRIAARSDSLRVVATGKTAAG